MSNMAVSLLIRLATAGEGAVRRAARNIRDLTGATEEQRRANRSAARASLDAANSRQQAARGAVMEAAALAAGFGLALRPAIEFEDKMSEVGKVVDFASADGMPALGRAIKDLSTELPIAAGGIADIVAALGQAGIVATDLSDAERIETFTRLTRRAAQAAVAFGVSAGEAGAAMANFQAGAGLTEAETEGLLNTINFLGNSMNANAPALLAVTNRMLTVGMTAGLAANDVAALGAALLQSGAAPEIAGTALKNFVGALTDGEGATKRQTSVLAELGFGAVDLAKRMQVDAKGAILDVIEALRGMDDAKRGSMVSMLFGEEGKAAIMPLIANVDELTTAFGLAGDEMLRPTSMLAEYEKKVNTTKNALTLMTNGLNVMAIDIGTAALPRLRELTKQVNEASGAIAEWAAANPESMETIVDGVGFVIGALVGIAGLRWVIGTVKAAGSALWLAMTIARGHPVLAGLALVATAAWTIYENWDAITGAVGRAIDKIKEYFALDDPERLEERGAAAEAAHSRGAAGRGAGGPSAFPMPARASGGPVSAGGVYRINERGQELFAPGRSGSILTAASVRAAFGSALGDAPRALSGGALGRGAGAAMGPVTIHVHPPAGASAGDIGAAVRREVEALMRETRMGGLHDGAALA